MTAAPLITKADGSKETYDSTRLVQSLIRAGAGHHTAERIAEAVSGSIIPGASSHEVYTKAFTLLRREARPVAARYALRRALLELGPTGHPFEDFVTQLFVAEGWKVETRRIIQGRCVRHETDLYASHPERGEYLAAELKYHNDPAYKTDLKVALYVKSRFDDIFSCDAEVRACPIDRGLLVTNTKFTSEAVAYATCAGVELLGWNYPEQESLFMRMHRSKVYPVTALTNLSGAEKKLLIEHGTITVAQVVRDRSRFDPLRLPAERIGQLLAEADGLLTYPEAS